MFIQMWLRVLALLHPVRRDERGASGVEYAILVGVIAVVIILAVVFLGEETSRSFSCTGDELKTKGAGGC